MRFTRGNKMKFSSPLLIPALSIAFNAPVFAEEQSPIIVTATRTAQTVDDSLASVTVITAKQIEQQQPDDLIDLLNAISGIDMTNNGGMGKATSMFMRGTSSAHVLVMIDGIKIGSATSGSIAFQHIPVSQIERIEIVRGPRSSLYGSEAIGGVIQIFTKKGTKQEQANIELSYGTYATSKISAGISGGNDKTTYSINASSLKTNGFDAKDDSETDNDGYNNESITLNISHKISDSSSLVLSTMQANGETEYDGNNLYTNNSAFIQRTTGLQYTARPLENWGLKFSASESLDESDNFTGLTFKSRYNTRRTNYSWQNDITIASNQILTVGLDYQNDSIVSTTAYNETSRDNTAAYIQQQWNGDDNDIQLALRNDDNQAFGSHNTGNIAWGHNFSETTRLISSYGTAFKAPTFNDLYWPSAGDPNLKPESSKTAELELRKKHSWGKASVSVYNTQIEDLISGWPPTNVNKAEINGVEIRIDTKFAGWDTKVELAVLDPQDTTTNKVLRRRAKQTFRLDMDKASGDWKYGISLVARGHSYDDAANTKRVAGYGIVNLRTQYKVSDKLTLKGKIENLFDKEYETVRTYNTPSIGIFVSLNYQGF